VRRDNILDESLRAGHQGQWLLDTAQGDPDWVPGRGSGRRRGGPGGGLWPARGGEAGGRGPSPWRGLRNPPKGGRRRRGGPRRGGPAGGGRFLGPRVQGAAPSARPSARRHCRSQPSRGALRAQVSGRPWGEGAGRSIRRVRAAKNREACAPRLAVLGHPAGAGWAWDPGLRGKSVPSPEWVTG
jgi:hypothetical protein